MSLVFLAPSVVRAVEARFVRKPYHIGFLSVGARPGDELPPLPLRQALETYGYRQGRDYEFVNRWAEAHRERLPALVGEVLASGVDVVVTQGSSAAMAASKASTTVPIVMTLSGDPVGVGLVSSLAHPGTNITGITDDSTALSAKRLQLLKEIIPSAKAVAVLFNSDDLAMNLRVQEIDRAAKVLNVNLRRYGVREPDDFEAAFAAMSRERPDALVMVTDALTNLNRRRVINFAEQRRIPAMYEYGTLVHEGGLVSYGPSIDEMFQRAALFVDKILKGIPVGDLPIEEPTRFYLVVNARTATALDLSIPRAIMLRADEVIG
jgi:putative ABC transport system substrate-binding protein